MRFRSMLAVGLAVVLLPNWPTRAGAGQSQTGEEKQASSDTFSRGIETTRSGNNTVQTDRTGKGAVLCMWGILEAVRAAGRECFKGQDPAFQAELDHSMTRIDRFIIRNSTRPVTQAALEARRVQGLQQLHAYGNICTGDAAKMYGVMRASGAAQLRAGTTELLSIPREPVTNPCL